MKIAICISGQLRGNRDQWKRLLSPFSAHDLDVYVDIWDKMGVTSGIDRVLPSGYLQYFHPSKNVRNINVEYFYTAFPILSNCLSKGGEVDEKIVREVFEAKTVRVEKSPETFVTEKKFKEVKYPQYLVEKNPRDFFCLLMFYKIWSCFQLVKDSAVSYDFVVRLRPDTVFPKEFTFDFNGIDDEVVVRDLALDDMICDQFAVGSYAAMEKYSSLWEFLPQYWSEPKDELSAYLISGGLLQHHLERLDVPFSKRQLPFTLSYSRPSLEEFLDMLAAQNDKSESLEVIRSAREVKSEIVHNKIVNKEISLSKKTAAELIGEFVLEFGEHSEQLEGVLQERLGNYKKAKNNYSEAIVKDPNSFMACWGLSRVYNSLGKIDLSIGFLTEAIEIRPGSWFCMRELARLFASKGDRDSALYWLNKAKDLSSSPSIARLEQELKKSFNGS